MNIECIITGMFEANCYLVWNDPVQTLVIDPGADAENIIDFFRKHGLQASAYLLTHGHIDHISSLADMVDVYPAPVGIHSEDEKWAFSSVNQMPPFYPAPRQLSGISRHFEDGQKWSESGLNYEIIATPGHSPGSVCFYFPEEKALFSGDTLFEGSVGRTDLQGGNSIELAHSLKKLSFLPGDTSIYPGHGPSTTMQQELQANEFMNH